MKTNSTKKVDRIQALKCLIHTESEVVDDEILECLLDPAYESFAGVCDYMDKNNMNSEDVKCVVENNIPTFIDKSTGEVIQLNEEVEENG